MLHYVWYLITLCCVNTLTFVHEADVSDTLSAHCVVSFSSGVFCSSWWKTIKITVHLNNISLYGSLTYQQMVIQAYTCYSGAFSSLRDAMVLGGVIRDGWCCCVACASRGYAGVESFQAGQLDDPSVFWIQYIEQLRDPWTLKAMLGHSGLGPSSSFQRMSQVCSSDATCLLLEKKRLCERSTSDCPGGAIS